MLEKALPKRYTEREIKVQLDGWENLWPMEVLFEFLKDEETKAYLLLGLDLFSKDPETQLFKFADACWGVNSRASSETYSEYCLRARKEALLYIENQLKGKYFYFYPVITTDQMTD